MGRRDFLNYLIGAAMLTWSGFALATVLKVATPPARRLDGSTKLEWLPVGDVAVFGEDPREVFYGDETVYVYRLNGRLVAYSATCPHVRCLVKWSDKENLYHCPCHASAFDKDGKRLYGPATRGLWPQKIRVQDKKVYLGGGTPTA